MENKKQDIYRLTILAVVIVIVTLFIAKFYSDTLPEAIEESKIENKEVYPDAPDWVDVGNDKEGKIIR